MPATHPPHGDHDHDKGLVLFSGITGGIVVAAFAADPIFGLAALAVGGFIINKKLSHHPEE